MCCIIQEDLELLILSALTNIETVNTDIDSSTDDISTWCPDNHI